MRGGVGNDDQGYIVLYSTPALLAHAVASGLKQHYLFNISVGDEVKHLWLTWEIFEFFKNKPE